MKKSIILFTSVLFFASCERKGIENSIIENAMVDPVYNAKYLLDYRGVYRGAEHPIGAGETGQVIITLDENGYTKEVFNSREYAQKKTVGVYKWDETGTVITLIEEDKPNQYFVAENTLTFLDVNGNLMTGDMADKYILTK